ncbi:MAG TPA: hypothetical protein VNJ46_01335 [Gaiellaceae bacterium]|nr:hypothetical protein [Gaiellaceae bacterium]
MAILAGQAAGPGGLGTVYAGFAAYAAVLGLQRSYITTPLVARTATEPRHVRAQATSAALTLVVASSVLAGAGFALAGWAIGGTIGRGLLLFAPWLLPALIQQFWRAIFFRDGLTFRAVLNDFAWFAVLLAMAPLALRAGSEGVAVAAWGLGSAAAVLLAWGATRQPLGWPRAAVQWWRHRASRFGSWLALQEFVFIVSGYAMVVVLAEVLGREDLGGMRAAESVFAPISLVAPALILPGLPIMARANARSSADARRLAVILSGIATAATAVYSMTMIALSSDVLHTVFGADFARYHFLVWPMGTWQIIAAAAIGFTILLQAEQRGRALAIAGAAGSLSGVCLVSLLAFASGVRGAAWGYAAAAALATGATIWFALRRRERS